MAKSDETNRSEVMAALARFDLGRKADNVAALAVRWRAKAGTWAGLAALLLMLPASASAHTVKATIRTWGRSKRHKAGGTGQGKEIAAAVLDAGAAALSSPATQAALASAGVPPQLATAIAATATSLSDTLNPDEVAEEVGALVAGAVEDASSPEGLFERAHNWVSANPWEAGGGLATVVGALVAARKLL